MAPGTSTKLIALLFTMVLVDGLLFQGGFYWVYDVVQNWDLIASLKYLLSIFWSLLFWSLWALVGSGLAARRTVVVVTGAFLSFVFGVSLYFKAEFFHLPNVNTLLFSLNEPLNAFVLMREKILDPQFLVAIPVFLVCLYFCRQLLETSRDFLAQYSTKVRRIALGVLLVVFIPISTLSLGWHRFAYPLTFDANAARVFFQQGLMLGGNKSNLRHPTRLPVAQGAESPVNIVLIINESLRADAFIAGLDFTDDFLPTTNTPFFQRLVADQNFVVFPNAYANSNTTNVSVPSLLTGLPPQSTSTDFHTMPLAWNYAEKVGNQTFLFSSQDWTWEHFDHFFFSRDIDHIFHRQSVQEVPLRNDLGIDDQITFEHFEKYIQTLDPKRPFFGVLQYNNSHPPFFGGEASLDLEPYSKVRYLSAVRMVDALIFKAIEAIRAVETDRPTLVFLTADHGESLKYRKVGRHNNFHEEMVRVPFGVVLVPGKGAGGIDDLRTRLRSAAPKVVQNVDLIPTFLDLWGMAQGPKLSGVSLLGEVPEVRSVTGLGTCEIRKWSPEGFFVRLGHKKLVVAEHNQAQVFDLSVDPKEAQGLRLDPQGQLFATFQSTITQTQAMKDICRRIGEASCRLPTR